MKIQVMSKEPQKDGLSVKYNGVNNAAVLSRAVEYPLGAVLSDEGGVWHIESGPSLEKYKDAEQFEDKVSRFVPAWRQRELAKSYPGDLMLNLYKNPYFVLGAPDDQKLNFYRLDKHVDLRTFEMRLKELEYACFYLVRREESMGNTLIPKAKFVEELRKLLERTGHPTNSGLIEAFIKSRSDIFYRTGEYITLRETYIREAFIFTYAKQALSGHSHVFGYKRSKELAGEQNDALSMLASGPNIMAMSGGPGTGKTTILKEFVTQYKTLHPEDNVYALAPSNCASQRTRVAFDGFPCETSTIHYFEGFGHVLRPEDKQRMQNADVIIIDESGMLDISVFYELIVHLDPSKVKLILVGDADQLPSVGPGEVFADLINLGLPTVYLTENHRSTKGITTVAQDINTGVLPEPNEEFELLPENGDIHPQMLDFKADMILTPYRKASSDGNCSTINTIAHSRHPQNYLAYAPGEPIMMLTTDRKRNYYNGQMGIVTSVSTESVNVLLDGRDDILRVFDMDSLTLAYATTVHKAQGSEYEHVAIALPTGSETFFTRQMLYTAVTRAKKKVTLVASDETLKKVIENDQKMHRLTNLKYMDGRLAEKAKSGRTTHPTDKGESNENADATERNR